MGCAAEERYFAQPVLVSVTLSFSDKRPSCCVSDNLAEACCYVAITTLIEEIANSKSYALIEHLAYMLMEGLAAQFSDKVSKIEIQVGKERPPVPNLLKPISFKITRNY
ncbi:dihydroneopterin aldolase [Chlamydia ibidis]|uniref:7,8-dihydroneopterin aldolase n=2 Tax=Chlamydia ibidis TaxID=1405396 RepID=S7J257_9CHLA|nr:dihydroneopterin aldolase [Chlamydia ibidis]EQM63083.1 dihydroneopterin aldolase [Chlamydia ibidis 10-1398/6]